MEELYVLGTGNATAVWSYNTCFAIKDEEDIFLTDSGGGNGILKILEEMDLGLEKIHHVFISHCHMDHCLYRCALDDTSVGCKNGKREIPWNLSYIRTSRSAGSDR